MGKKEKLIARLKSNPKDFTFDEADALLSFLAYSRSDKGKTSGSRIMYTSKTSKTKIILHRPHPGNELKDYQIKQIIMKLEQEGLI